jgi:hypothetical protein
VRRWAALVFTVMGCAPARQRAISHPTVAPVAVVEEIPSTEHLATLDEWIAHPTASPERWGVLFAHSTGALSITGDAAPDETVQTLTRVTHVGASVAILLETTCGNVSLVGMQWFHGAWRAVSQLAVVDTARPGACLHTHAQARGCAMLEDSPREIVITWETESEDGAAHVNPSLRVYHLHNDATLEALSRDVPFGGTNDRTGAVRDAQWVVDETFPLPRDLYVQEQPGRMGLGGSAPPFVVRRTYRLHHRLLELVDETSERVRPRVPLSDAAPSTTAPDESR